ncbi:MAG: type I restriction endonuclease subunit R [Cyanobacteria bacterium SBLK]|nr:type I restriction endonuclease subunit R [Cyanobacteria bacterium SBLK]
MKVVKPEIVTQNRVIKLFTDELEYQYLGNWQNRENNSNIEPEYLNAYLTKNDYTPAQIAKSLDILQREANNPNRSLYENNKAIYGLLRYGIQIKTEVGENTQTIKLIDWENPDRNDFYIAEEVTLKGKRERRPDLVLYLNGIAIAAIELKKSNKSLSDGIRQNISNQSKEFNEWFYSTVQILFAGSNTGLKYGTIKTAEKYYLTWKEDPEDDSRNILDKYLLKLCNKQRLLEIIYDFVLFDGGIKKLPRFHQYFGIKAAQTHVNRGEGGIIWHTQGSGKSIVMVLLAKWILENKANARVAIITDRDELDDQIEGIFTDVGETIHRSSSGRDLIHQLGQAKPRLLCSLIHKFGRKKINDFDLFIQDLEAQPSPAIGDIFVFIDECHRTQSGKLHRIMKAILPDAVFIGFTGTPLLKKDKKNSREVFGNYIHTYKFSEAVDDAIVLDLLYEARDVDQRLSRL